MTATQEQFESAKEDIRTISGMVAEIRETVIDHSYHISLMRAQFGGFDLRLGNMERRMDSMEHRFAGVEGQLEKVNGRLDGLQGSVSEILTLVRKSS